MRKFLFGSFIASLLPASLFAAALSIQSMPGLAVSGAEASALFGGCATNDSGTVTVCCNGGVVTVNKQKDDAAGKKDGSATACSSTVSCTYTPLGDENCGG